MIEYPVTRIVFLPTAQYDPDNPWLPNRRGILRIKAAIEALTLHPGAAFIVAGGYANHRGFTYSDRMVGYIAKHHPWMVKNLVLVSGFTNRTMDDLFQSTLLLAGLLAERGIGFKPSKCDLIFCSEYLHYARARLTIQVLGLNPQLADSGAEASIYDERDHALAEEIVPGKILGLGRDAAEWAEQARQNALAQADYCRLWADTHAQADAVAANGLYETLVRLRAEGVYIESPAIFPTRARPAIPIFD
jgi:hypothetical protein